MMGARLEKSALLLGDNNSVVLNTTMPSSVLKKKHCAVSYHKIRETKAADIIWFCQYMCTIYLTRYMTKPYNACCYSFPNLMIRYCIVLLLQY